MKNPFKFFRSAAEKTGEQPQPEPEMIREEIIPQPPAQPHQPSEPEDHFTEWCRSQVRGGIERRERNDIFEAYSVYGTDGQELICRYYHRYPEHERNYDLSYSRRLNFDDFNRRLLSELDKGDLKLPVYNDCIQKAQEHSQVPADNRTAYEGFSESETAVLRGFCESIDTLREKEYRSDNGVFYCSCVSAVGDERLNLRFRKPLPHDALYRDVAGVGKKSIGSYDIENLWILGICNRFFERCENSSTLLLTSEWSLNHEQVYLMSAEDFPGVSGTLLLAVADEAAFPHFGFYSLDFSAK